VQALKMRQTKWGGGGGGLGCKEKNTQEPSGSRGEDFLPNGGYKKGSNLREHQWNPPQSARGIKGEKEGDST